MNAQIPNGADGGASVLAWRLALKPSTAIAAPRGTRYAELAAAGGVRDSLWLKNEVSTRSASLPAVAAERKRLRRVSPNPVLNRMAAIAHPKRLAILQRIDAGRVSPSEVAAALGESSSSSVSYHFRALLDLGMIDLVGEEQARGALKHFYEVNENGRAAIALASETGLV